MSAWLRALAARPCSRTPFLLASGLLLALSAFPIASAAPPLNGTDATSASDGESGMLRVLVAPEIVDARLISGWIDERNQRVEEQVPSFEGHEQWIDVSITGVTYDYRISVLPMRDGAVVGSVPSPAVCACNSDQLLALVDERIAGAIEALQTAPLEPESELVVLPRPDGLVRPALEPPPSPPPPTSLHRRRLSGLGIAGAVLTGVGGSAVAGGVAMTALDSRLLPDLNETYREWRPVGVTTLAAGGAVLIAGVSMLVADAARCRKDDAPRRCRRHPEGLAVSPVLEVAGGGVTLVGRF